MGIPQVVLFIDRGAEYRRDVPEFQMLSMAEVG